MKNCHELIKRFHEYKEKVMYPLHHLMFTDYRLFEANGNLTE